MLPVARRRRKIISWSSTGSSGRRKGMVHMARMPLIWARVPQWFRKHGGMVAKWSLMEIYWKQMG